MAASFSFWRTTIWALISTAFIAFMAFLFLFAYVESELPNVDALKTVDLQVPLRIYTKEGQLIQEYGEKRRIPLPYDQVPPLLIKAILVTEDQRFFEHPGVDILGLGRAAISVIQTGSKSQGGSTITMQVARNFFLSRKKTFFRKFNEILLAIKIDKELSKQKILELYLNKIYLGNRAYGVGAAAQIYYGKPLNTLNLAELAMIAGLPQAPSVINPINSPAAAKKRRDHVLDRLLEEGIIDKAAHDHAQQAPIVAHYHGARIEVSAPYAAEMIRQSLYQHFGKSAYTKGYKVYTTLSGPLQTAANQSVIAQLLAYDHRHGYRGSVGHVAYSEQVPVYNVLKSYPSIPPLEAAWVTDVHERSIDVKLQNGHLVSLPWSALSWARPALRNGYMGRSPTNAYTLAKKGDIIYVMKNPEGYVLSQIPAIEGALVALSPNTGGILALVGGIQFEHSKFNRATQSLRQPGSSFKPFIYAAALQKGYSLATLINDAPIVMNDPSLPHLWRPHNSHNTFDGPIRLKDALVRSVNLVPIRILDDIGVDYVIPFLNHLGFNTTTMPHGLSLALGSLSISPLELTTAYAIFANGGYRVEPYFVEKITDNRDHILVAAKPSTVPSVAHTGSAQIPAASRVLSSDVAFLMNAALQEVIQKGTGSAAKILNRHDIAGKTGTTNEQVDGWFAGYSPDIAVTVWAGFDTPKSLHEYGHQTALPMWIAFMKEALPLFPEKNTPMPDNVVAMAINPKTGLLANEHTNHPIQEYFRKDEIPALSEETEAVITQNGIRVEEEQGSLF
ncbi:MAG: penicillin-binding protein 1A [Legionellaceae bacterium]|nr:penicillin-binding protein 1A [Legionellaceae bacterium]